MIRLLIAGLFAVSVLAAAPSSSLLGITAGKNGGTLSVPMQIVILLTLLTLLPAVVMSITPFLRITVVLHFLRQALGTQTRAFQPGADRTGAVPDHPDHAAGGHRRSTTRPGSRWRKAR